MVNEKILKACGFIHEEFPDGWFWHINPTPDSQEAKIIGKALGFSEADADEWADTIILQMSDEGVWTYVFGADVGKLTSEEAEGILDQIANLKQRPFCPYCDGDEALFHDAEHDISVFIDSQGNLMVSAGEKTAEFTVEFCPKCGRLFNEPLTKGMRIWYVDQNTGEIEEGEVFSVYYKDGKLDSFCVNFIPSDDFDEFDGSKWGDCFFSSAEKAKAALLKGKDAHEKTD